MFLFAFLSFCHCSPTYFTIWLNNGERLSPYIDQLIDQNLRFNDLLIGDLAVQPHIRNHRNFILVKTVFQQARTKQPQLSQKLSRLESVYDIIKPHAASDILRVVSFTGLDGEEFIYHDVVVKISIPFRGSLSQPISSAMIGKQSQAHLSKNWVMNAVFAPTRDRNLDGVNINIDLICVVRSKSTEIISEYIDKASSYFENSLNIIFKTSGGERITLQEIVTNGSPDESYTLENIQDYKAVTGITTENYKIRSKFSRPLSRRSIQ